MAPQMGGALLMAIVPFSAAMLALAGALAAACFVKVFGVVFLGHARSKAAAQAQEVDGWMQAGMAIPAIFCLLLGVLPVLFIPLIDAVPQMLLHASLADSVHAHGWLWLTPVSASHASYSSPLALAGMIIVGGLVFWWLHPKGQVIRRSRMWSCGNPHLNARMQYNATSFSQPLRRIFWGVLQPDEHVHVERRFHKLLTTKVRYTVHVGDLAVKHLYQPIGRLTLSVARWLNTQHQYGIHTNLTWTFVTVILLLALFA